MNPLFEPRTVWSSERPTHSEAGYTYLARSGRVEAQRVRQLLERWFSSYPEHARADLRSRFRSRRDDQHQAATFELYLFHLLKELGYDVEVRIPSHGGKPDFRASSSNSPSLILEATSATEATDQERGAERRIQRLLDELEKISSNRFTVDVSYRGAPRSDITVKQVIADVQVWLDSLDFDRLRLALDSGDDRAFEERSFDVDGLTLKLTAVPRRRELVGTQPHRMISAIVPDPRWSTTDVALQRAIRRKAQKYNIGSPYVIAVNCAHFTVDCKDVFSALFGSELAVIALDSSGARLSHMKRAPNGLLGNPSSPRWTRISGVLIIADLNPWSLGVRTPVMYLNPFAARPLAGPITTLTSMSFGNGSNFRFQGGAEPWRLFGLWPGWPEGEEPRGDRTDAGVGHSWTDRTL